MRSIARAILVVAALTGCHPKWKEFVWRDGEFAVLVPGQPHVERHHVQAVGGGEILAYTFEVKPGDGVEYFVGYYDINDLAMRAQGSDVLLSAQQKGTLAMLDARLVSWRQVSLGDHPGQESVMEQSSGKLTSSRAYLVDNRMYYVYASVLKHEAPRRERDVKRFLDSFRLVPRQG